MPNRSHLSTLALLLAAGAAPALAADVPCSVAQATFISAELVCAVSPAAQPTQLHFQVRFDGVHDDSFAGASLQLDGQPVACEGDSRLRLQGENEGDALSCAFKLSPHEAARELRLRLNWSHAEPGGYTLKTSP